MARTKKLENVESGGWPKVNQGSHLTVLTYEDGRTELKWDDDALLRDVQAALSSVSVEVAESKVKKTRAKKAKA